MEAESVELKLDGACFNPPTQTRGVQTSPWDYTFLFPNSRHPYLPSQNDAPKFLLPFTNRVWNFTATTQVYPKEKNHAHMSDKGRELGVKKDIPPVGAPRQLFSVLHEVAEMKNLENPPGLSNSN
jgi:hypothetical protein